MTFKKIAGFPLLEDGQLVWATVKGLNVCAIPLKFYVEI